MQIREMFAKPIDRDLQGVIIVGQDETANVKQELEEYVVTRELQKHFADFFAAYKAGIIGNTSKTGVWISGFFGSGKSHFLKILSYLLENKEIAGKKAIDYFADDNKIADPMVLADMQLAANTSTDVVLFNIDSKSDSNSKQNKDAIVNVFLKVFNEMQGYCGAMPFLADLERRLNEEGKYEEFKQKFEENYGDAWTDSRQDFDFIQDDIVDTLVDMDFMSEAAARNWCEKAAEPYKISIEDFAKRLKAYIDRKGNNHHVAFLVDEVGQYIGDDSNLMLNLQTVREELGKECNGKAWVIVTSQQDIDSITKVKGNDFSKIQGRFDTRISLSSANVDEVIKKRILDKKDTAAQMLRLLYGQKATTIKNKIVFNDGVEKKLYADEDDFALVYPFVPYQFNLLASVLTSIRTHGASGKHLSEGERSMLAMFKESAMDYKEHEEGTLIPFHAFYDALENFLDYSHRGVIIKAYDNSYINPDHKTKGVFAINAAYGEDDIRKMFKTSNQISLNLEGGTEPNIHALDDVLSYVADNTRMHMKTSMKSIKDRFMKAPYGFVEDDVHWLVAKLFRRGDLAFYVNGSSVSTHNKEAEELINYITKKSFVDKLMIEQKVRVSEKEMKITKDIMKELFGATGSSDDEDVMMNSFIGYANKLTSTLGELEVRYESTRYPGKQIVEYGRKLLFGLVQIQTPTEFFQTVAKKQDDLLDFAEDYEPVKAFFNSEQKTIFDKAVLYLSKYDDSKTYIVDENLENIVAQISEIVKKQFPYSDIPKLPELLKKFSDVYSDILDEQLKPVLDSVYDSQKRVFDVLNTKEYAETKRSKYSAMFDEITNAAKGCTNVSVLRSYADRAEALKIRLLNEMTQMDQAIAVKKAEEVRKRLEAQAKEVGNVDQAQIEAEVQKKVEKVKKTKNVSIKSITKTASWRLENTEDVDKYLNELRLKLVSELDTDTIVNIEF